MDQMIEPVFCHTGIAPIPPHSEWPDIAAGSDNNKLNENLSTAAEESKRTTATARARDEQEDTSSWIDEDTHGTLPKIGLWKTSKDQGIEKLRLKSDHLKQRKSEQTGKKQRTTRLTSY